MMAAILFSSVFLVLFAYLGYPLTLIGIGLLRGREVQRSDCYPAVTVMVTVHNEERRIREKLANTLELDYPRDKLQILVASDGSNDRTNEIVREYESQGVQLVELPDRGGKENAQKEALKVARGQVIVFSDVATRMERVGLRRLTSNFVDPSVGCVSSEDRLVREDGQPSGEGLYVRYEMWLRSLESKANSLVGLSGSLFAARSEVCKDFSGEVQSDFRTVLNSVELGLRGVSDPLVVGFYQDVADQSREWDRKIRTVVRGLTVFFRHKRLLNVFRYGLFSYQLFCHKLLRWLVPLFLILALVSNLTLVGDSYVFSLLFAAQLVIYGLAIMGLLRRNWQDFSVVRIPAYFVAVNASILVAWWQYLRGRRIVTWTPTTR